MRERHILIAIGAALLVLACIPQAKAEVVGVHIGSQHFPSKDFNNVNPGLYYIADSGATVGGYYNSERKLSLYAGYTYDYGPFRLQVGAITGYSRPVLPMLAPSVALGHGFRLIVLPKVERGGASVIHITWETKL